jgi:hypothetical protein
MNEFVLPYDVVKRLASRLGISLDGLSGDDYAQCHHHFERFVRPVEAAIELGIVRLPPIGCENGCVGHRSWQHAPMKPIREALAKADAREFYGEHGTIETDAIWEIIGHGE